MKKWILLLVLMLLPAAALGEMSLSLSAERLGTESVLDFSVDVEAETYRYTVYRDGEELFSHETAYAFGSYVPRKTGAYTLLAQALHNGEVQDHTEASFEVVQKLTCELLLRSQNLSAGQPQRAEVTAEGGTGGYRYVYSILAEDEVILQQQGGSQWFWSPGEAGDYTLMVTVVDEAGSAVNARADFTAEAGLGISAEAADGALYAHGGVKSWAIFAPEKWTAHTESDFLTLETSEGEPGEWLIVSVEEETDTYREGIVTIESAGKTMELSVGQSAQHGVEEEVSLFGEEGLALADGKMHTLWLNAEGSRTFTVTADQGWTAEAEPWIEVAIQDDQLTVTAEQAADELRTGTVKVTSGAASAYIHLYQLPHSEEKQAITIEMPEETSGFTLYSQSSGLWKERKYGVSTLEHSGCAIFALSHALQCMGYEGEAIQPEALAKKYAFCLRDGGTVNSTLIGNAGDDFGYKTRYELYEDLSTIRSRTEQGAVWSFSVVNGHIAMIAEMNEDGTMFRVIDSAPSATWERIKNAQLYRREGDGSFTAIESLTELDDMRYYIENGAFGGATYWLEDSYVARRGVRLIQRRDD